MFIWHFKIGVHWDIDKRDIDNIRRRSVNIELIRRTLRWSPTFTIDKGLKETYGWILDNISK